MTEQNVRNLRIKKTEDALEIAEHMTELTGREWRAESTDETWTEWRVRD